MPTIDRQLSGLPRRAVVAFAVRAARRVVPLIGLGADHYPEAWEWLRATAETVRVVEAYVRGREVSRFTLDVAAELPRVAANALASSARRLGPTPAMEQAEIAFAVAAFAADSARAPSSAQAARVAAQAAATAEAGHYKVAKLLAFDAATLAGLGFDPSDDLGPPIDPTASGPVGELWPTGEPVQWSNVWVRLAESPRLLVLSGD